VPDTTRQEARHGGAPASALDPFADGFLRDPFAFHAQLRDAGPVVWLERYGIWAMARYTEVHDALRDWATFSSSAGVGLSDFRKEKPWRPPSLLLEADPPEHSRARKAVARAMSPRTIAALREDFAREADSLVIELLDRDVSGAVDGVTDIAEAYPLRVFPRAVGITQDCGDQLLAYGNMAFNAFGPHNELQTASMAQVQGVAAWIAAHCAREALGPGGLGDRIYASADEGAVTEDEAALLVRSLLTAGVDTTVIGLGCALDCLAHDPAQWRLLRDDPSLAGAAFEETLRYASPVQTFFRTTTRDVEVGGVAIGAGEKVLLFLAAANRDPPALARPGPVRHPAPRQRACRLRLWHPCLRRGRVRPAGGRGPAASPGPAGAGPGIGGRAAPPAEQHPQRLRLPAAHAQSGEPLSKPPPGPEHGPGAPGACAGAG
jgi:cytochrome P450